ncbi:hypothetical protein [Paraburkholderia hospita]|uniref:hypothetical protein n=1 Tax=Paraburkholderia hospita TaxID=169430 RepID=UPI000B3425ED|nr:hypothetical protein [Paraburkholderia hospita]OUL68705.1 hypothetical protein CA603_51610 [Paraburkholderia hospita]
MAIKRLPLAQRIPSPYADLEKENRWLRNELFIVRHTLINLMDPKDLLYGYLGIDEHEKLIEWRINAVKAVTADAQVRPGDEMGDPRWPRALCPLCRQGAQGTRDVRGYAVPEGLRRHLLGELNSRQCDVFAAAVAIAREGIREKRLSGPHVR